jgi:hypothetical protein
MVFLLYVAKPWETMNNRRTAVPKGGHHRYGWRSVRSIGTFFAGETPSVFAANFSRCANSE